MSSTSSTVKYPFGAADVQTLTATGTQAQTVSNGLTVFDGVTNQASGNRTISLAIDASMKIGSKIVAKLSTASTQTTTFGTGFTAPTLTGVAGKTFVCEFVYDGTNFLAIAAPYQIN